MSIKENILLFNDKQPREFDLKDFSIGDKPIYKKDNCNYVNKGFYNPTGQWVAMKYFSIPKNNVFLSDDEKQQLNALKREVKNFRILSECDKIINFYGFCTIEDTAIIVMELMDFSLWHLYHLVHRDIYAPSLKFPELILGIIAARITDALAFCKGRRIMHRDVKPGNILINHNGEVKLCDFGVSKLLSGSLTSSLVGTYIYWPPEHFDAVNKPPNSSSYDVRADVWSLGITLLEIAYGNIPYLDASINPQPNWNDFVTVNNAVSSANPWNLIQKCFNNNYSAYPILFVGMCLDAYERRPKFSDLTKTHFYLNHVNHPNQIVADFIRKYSLPNYTNANEKVVSMDVDRTPNA